MNGAKNSTGSINLLSSLVLGQPQNGQPQNGRREDSRQGNGGVATNPLSSNRTGQIAQLLADYGPQDFGGLWGLASSHHVTRRALPELQRILRLLGNSHAEWVEHALEKEGQRIQHALSFLSSICAALEEAGDVVVIKSFDHWPDLGSDLDLYSNAGSAAVVAIMRQRFQANVAERSWGDRLANKWNFMVPGLPELVEVHVGRLGQTGEQVAITSSLIADAATAQFGSYHLRVPAPENRIIISTLQRMYRHFYFRLCDIADTASLIDAGALDFVRLKALAESAGLWEGVATFLAIVSGYVEPYRSEPLDLPTLVTRAAKFGSERVSFRRRFLRIPIFPQAATLYFSELERLLLNGELRNTFRLSLLPGLAAAAALEFKLTGSDKGVW